MSEQRQARSFSFVFYYCISLRKSNALCSCHHPQAAPLQTREYMCLSVCDPQLGYPPT